MKRTTIAMSLSLPLAVMEEFFFWDDRPAYPCDCFIRLCFSGCLDQMALGHAIRAALARHPLLSAKVEFSRRRRLQWAVVDEPEPVIVWEEAPVGGPLPPAGHLDLTREIGIRFHVRTDAAKDASDLTIQFHHACCDAGGIAGFIRDLLLTYSGWPLPSIDPELLAGRGRFGLTMTKLLKMAPRLSIGLLGARQFLMRRPVPVIPCDVVPNDAPPPEGYPAVISQTLDAKTTAGLRQSAKQLGVTLNDLLAHDLFQALSQWRRRHGAVADDHWMRMMVPMNLRTEADLAMPAANVVSSVFLDRREQDLENPHRLLAGIHAEMEVIKRNQLGFMFVFSLAVCRRLMGSLKKRVRADRCAVSCVFTNIGGLFDQLPLPKQDGLLKAGNVTLTHVDPVGPIHPYSCVTMVASLYARRLVLTLHYDPRPISESQAAELLATYAQYVEASAA